MSVPNDDAQRSLERRALRNVRDLVDRLDAGEATERRLQRRLLVAIVIGALLVALAIAAVLVYSARERPGAIEPVDLPPEAGARR